MGPPVSLSYSAGDRLLVRDRPWRIVSAQPLVEPHVLVELLALDTDVPRSLSVVIPPEQASPLPPEDLRFDVGSIDSVHPWLRSHRAIDATLVRDAGMLAGARFGRVALEAYQLAPALRVLARPRPNLLIADDVGLGKTIEAGLVLLELMSRGRASRVLIVTPPGLLEQWRDELWEKFALQFTIIENAAGLARVQTDLPAGISPWDALPRILTSIDFLKKETVRARALKKRWGLIIVDEAHALALSGSPQNPYATQRTRLGAALREASRGLLLLTATPHNGYSHSFQSLLALIDPTTASLHGSKEDLERRVESARIRRMKPQIRRRLPDGREEKVFRERTVSGIPVTVATEADRHLLVQVGSYCSRTARVAEGEDEADLISFAMQIVKKRALSSRRALAKTIKNRLEALRDEAHRENPPDRSELRDLRADLPLSDSAAERTAQRLLRSAIPKDQQRRRTEVKALSQIKQRLGRLSDRDPKVQALITELRAVFQADRTERAIVFTEYLDTLAAICERLDAEPDLRGAYVTMIGGLSSKQRLRRQAVFEQPQTRVLVATDAASEGLNLQRACRRVVHFELPWNPNRLEQRNGRVDRYGQERDPIVRYLYYPDSPEDDVLNALVEKIEQMRRDRVSTPDILGVIRGDGEIERGLVDLDPSSPDAQRQKASLVQFFEDRTAEFVRNVQPFITAGADTQHRELSSLLDLAQPLLDDDLELEKLVLDAIGEQAIPLTQAGLYRIETPVQYRGPGVAPIYLAATLRRSIAIRRKAEEVEFITPLHPLVQAIAADAKRRLLQVYTSDRGLPPRRLAVCRASAREAASALFTFLGTVESDSGTIEERVLAVRVTLDGSALGSADENERLLWRADDPADVDVRKAASIFSGCFDALFASAEREATRQLSEHVSRVRERRRALADLMRRDLETDTVDRLAEIAEDERRSRGLARAGDQGVLFGEAPTTTRAFETRRAAAQSEAEKRREEIAAFESTREPSPPRPMGALLLVPEERAT